MESPEILAAYLDDAVRQYSTAPVEDLRRGLTEVGIDMADQTINSRFTLPAGLAAIGLASQPHIAAAVGIAAGAVAIRRAGSSKARAAKPGTSRVPTKRPRNPHSADLDNPGHPRHATNHRAARLDFLTDHTQACAAEHPVAVVIPPPERDNLRA